MNTEGAQRVCPLCDAVEPDDPFDSHYRNREDGRVPMEDLRHFLVDCGVLQPMREKLPKLFLPACWPGGQGTADEHARFVMNHGDQHQVACALRCLQAYRAECLRLIDGGQQEQLLPEGYLPMDVVLQRMETVVDYDQLTEKQKLLVWGDA